MSSYYKCGIESQGGKIHCIRALSRRRVSSFFAYSVQTTCCGNEHLRHFCASINCNSPSPYLCCSDKAKWGLTPNDLRELGQHLPKSGQVEPSSNARCSWKNIPPGVRGATLRGCTTLTNSTTSLKSSGLSGSHLTFHKLRQYGQRISKTPSSSNYSVFPQSGGQRPTIQRNCFHS